MLQNRRFFKNLYNKYQYLFSEIQFFLDKIKISCRSENIKPLFINFLLNTNMLCINFKILSVPLHLFSF